MTGITQSNHYIQIRMSESEFYVLLRSATVSTTSALFFACIPYVVVRKYLKYLVYRRSDVASDNVGSRQADFALGLKYGRSPPPQLLNQWPLGIDWIGKLWYSDAEQHLLAFSFLIADEYEPRNSLFQCFLVGPRAFHILDLKNLEGVLSTNSKIMASGIVTVSSPLA